MTGFLDWGTKDDKARRNAQKKGIRPSQYDCPEQSKRMKRRLREDEAFAREMGVRLTYADMRR